MEHQILEFFANTPVNHAIRNISWLFAVCETVHFFGLSVLFGSLLLVDLRLIGVWKVGSGKAAVQFTYVAMVGFALNLISGFGCFSNNPESYWANPTFRLKMLLIAFAGLNLLWFELREKRKVALLASGEAADFESKIVASVSLILWTLVIVAGRWLPVTAGGGNS